MGEPRGRGGLLLFSELFLLFLAQISEPEARKGELVAIREEHQREERRERGRRSEEASGKRKTSVKLRGEPLCYREPVGGLLFLVILSVTFHKFTESDQIRAK